METRVFLIRHGITDWHEQGKLLGRADRPLCHTGLEQARRAALALAGVAIAEVISSPLMRALQTAELLGKQAGIEVARDHRLTDFKVGHWQGMHLADITSTREYRELLADPRSSRIPEGEHLDEARKRAVAAVEQALEDNPSGDAIAIITHAGVIRLLLAHYMGASAINMYHRLRVSPGSISVLSFAHDQLPRVLAINWCGALADVLEHRS